MIEQKLNINEIREIAKNAHLTKVSKDVQALEELICTRVSSQASYGCNETTFDFSLFCTDAINIVLHKLEMMHYTVSYISSVELLVRVQW